MKLKIYDSIENIQQKRKDFVGEKEIEANFEILSCGSIEITAEEEILEDFEKYLTS